MKKNFQLKEIFANPLFVIGLFLLIQIIIRPENMFISDPLVKAVQTFSLKFYNYTTQQIYYPAADIDPKFILNPLNEGFIFYNNGRFVSQYPVSISFLYSLLPVSNIKIFPYLNIIFLLPLLYTIKAYTKNNNILLFLLLLTVNFSIIIDFSENSFFYLFAGLGYLKIVESIRINSQKELIFGSILLSVSVWFRLEGILFIVSLLSSIYIVRIYETKKFNINNDLLILMIIFLTILLVFFVYNFFSYGHYMGPRYMANIESTRLLLKDKIIIFLSILFTFPRENNIAIGFYFYSPIFILVIYYFTNKFMNNSIHININLLTILIFSLLVGILSPNDGVTITGRYMACGIFPLVFLMDDFFLETRGLYKKLKIILISFSFLVSISIIITFHIISREFKKHSEFLNSHHADLFITSNELIGGSFSLGYLEKKIITIKKESDLLLIDSILNSNQFINICLVGYNQSKNNIYNPISNMHDITLKIDYICNEENHMIYKIYNCSKK